MEARRGRRVERIPLLGGRERECEGGAPSRPRSAVIRAAAFAAGIFLAGAVVVLAARAGGGGSGGDARLGDGGGGGWVATPHHSGGGWGRLLGGAHPAPGVVREREMPAWVGELAGWEVGAAGQGRGQPAAAATHPGSAAAAAGGGEDGPPHRSAAPMHHSDVAGAGPARTLPRSAAAGRAWPSYGSETHTTTLGPGHRSTAAGAGAGAGAAAAGSAAAGAGQRPRRAGDTVVGQNQAVPGVVVDTWQTKEQRQAWQREQREQQREQERERGRQQRGQEREGRAGAGDGVGAGRAQAGSGSHLGGIAVAGAYTRPLLSST